MRDQTSDSKGHAGHLDHTANLEIRDLANVLRKSAVDVAWRQWRALGASAALKKDAAKPLQSLVDPEALVLFSLRFLDDERRLADLLRDWIILNSDLLSVQRIKNLVSSYSHEVSHGEISTRVEALAKIAVENGKDFRWRSLQSISADHRKAGWEKIEDIGLAARQSKVRRMSTGLKASVARGRLTDPALLLRLRLALGVSIKADVLGFLLGTRDDWINIREIAEATRYSVRAIRRGVDDLAAAGFVLALDGQPTTYRAEKKLWAKLLRIEASPVWLYWHQRFAFVTAFVNWANTIETRPVSEYAFSAHARELMEQHDLAFGHNTIELLLRHPTVDDWGMYVRHAIHGLVSSMDTWA